jgi:uncharacterized protein (DUF2336 family)
MQTPSLSSLEGLTDIGIRRGVDMRPTLLRVLTDLYVQKLTHTPDEERHYTELALRLLETVDVATRSVVAARLAQHLAPPGQVMQRLTADLPEVAAALRSRALPQTRGAAAAAIQNLPVTTIPETSPDRARPAPAPLGTDVDTELNELFFAADANERRLILLNLHIVVALPAGRSGIGRDPMIGRKLEASALARNREDFARELAQSLLISRQQAQRIAGDPLGEPIVVAAKALGIPRDLLYRILLFVNTAVGHSVERVHALATLYDEISVQAAQDLVGVWQAIKINQDERAAPTHRRLGADDEREARAAPAVRRAPMSTPQIGRRNAS